MMKTDSIIIVLACLAISACKKREYPPEATQLEKESIYVDGYAGNEPMVLKVGAEGYYCYSSHTQRQDSIYLFEGILKKYDCNPCTRSLRVTLSDYRKRAPGAGINVDSSLREGKRQFLPELAELHMLKFNASSNKPVSFLRWDFSDGVSSTAANTEHEFWQVGVHTVSLTTRTLGNCENIVTQKFFIGTDGLFACNISASENPALLANFSASVSGGKGPLRYSWNFGDGGTGSSQQAHHTYQWPGSYPVKLVVEDADNNQCESNYIFVVGNDQSSCSSSITFSHTTKRTTYLDGVSITWIDGSNITFRSDKCKQPADSYFEIIKSEAFEPNERGEPGRLLTMRFNLMLSDGNRQIRCNSENAVIAVSYK
jgi:hypothetical protein